MRDANTTQDESPARGLDLGDCFPYNAITASPRIAGRMEVDNAQTNQHRRILVAPLDGGRTRTDHRFLVFPRPLYRRDPGCPIRRLPMSSSEVYPISQIVSDAWTIDVLRCAGFKTTLKFLQVARTPEGRDFLCKTLNLEPERAMAMANAADLMRINGIGSLQVAALRAVGVKTVRDLRCRNPHHLFTAILKANASARFMEFPPPLAFLIRWIEQAKTINLVITYRTGDSQCPSPKAISPATATR